MDALNGQDIIICEKIMDYVDAINRLSNESDTRNEIGNNGYKYVMIQTPKV